MQKRKFTVVTQLHEKNNHDIIEYVESSRSNYAKAVRETFYLIKYGSLNKSQYHTYLQHKYDILRRTASSIIFDAQGRFNAFKELKEYEKKQLERKIKHLESVVIPNNHRKSKTETKQGKKYNEMIHSLAYRQFNDIIENVTYRNKVNVIKVNPAWTSWLAKQIYCPTMKLNIHVGASYVIARRGQGYRDIIK